MIVRRAPAFSAVRRVVLPGMTAMLWLGSVVPASAQSLAQLPGAIGPTRATSHEDAWLQRASGPGVRNADAWKLAGLAATAAVLSAADRRGDAWARQPSVQDNRALRSLSRVGDVSGTYVAAGIGPAAWLLGRARADSGTAVLGLRTAESVLLGGVAIGAIKALSGRTRPYASADHSPSHWELFGGVRSDSTRSFASGHAALSAAAAVTLAAEWRRQGTQGWMTVGPPLVYALATLAAASRVRDRRHWLSDVAAGAAVGIASALLVRRWHDSHAGGPIDRAFLAR